MRHAHLPLSGTVLKQESDDLILAESFLGQRPARPKPEWYAALLDEYGPEIAIVVAVWLSSVRTRLSELELSEWTSILHWFEFEESLAYSLVPVLRRAGSEALRRQAVEGGIPVAVSLGDMHIVEWAGRKAAEESRLIADETRMALYDSLQTVRDAGLNDTQARRLLLDAGVFGLNRRFSASVLRHSLQDGLEFEVVLENATAHGNRLLEVRGETITWGNAVDAINAGMAIAALLWENDEHHVTKTWQTQEDELVCPICLSLHMQTVRRDEYFVDAYGEQHMHPKAHLRCRCFVAYRVRAEAESLFDLVL